MLSVSKVIGVLAMLAGLACLPARASSLDTDVDVTLPSVISLYCFDRVRVRLQQFDNETGTGLPGLTQDATGTPGNLEVTGPPMPYNVTNSTGIYWINNPSRLELSGVCAFRALAGANGVQVSIAPVNTVLEGPNNTSITLSRFRARDEVDGGPWQTSYNVDTTDTGLSELHKIDVRMRMQMTPTLYYGTYSSSADGTFQITVIANP